MRHGSVRSGQRVHWHRSRWLATHRAARYGRQVKGAIVIGVMARTGSAIAIALSGTTAAPQYRARRDIELVPPGLVTQPYHAAAGLDLAAAGT